MFLDRVENQSSNPRYPRWVGALALVALGMLGSGAVLAVPPVTIGLEPGFDRDAPASPGPKDALGRMLERAEELGDGAAYIFDLDETIVDSSPRRFRSILDAFAEFCSAGGENHVDCRVAERLDLRDFYRLRNRYDDRAYLRAAGAEDPAFIDAVLDRSFEIYLSGAYIVEEDRLYAGAKAFLHALLDSGAQVFFVSSRSRPRQEKATLEFLRRRGLVARGGENRLYLKPDGEVSVEFKRRAVEEIRRRLDRQGATVVGLFENEPENLMAWVEVFPHAAAFFVEGAYQKNGPIPRKSILLEDYRF